MVIIYLLLPTPVYTPLCVKGLKISAMCSSMLKLDGKYVEIHIFICLKISIIKMSLLYVNPIKPYKKRHKGRMNLLKGIRMSSLWALDEAGVAYCIIKTY